MSRKVKVFNKKQNRLLIITTLVAFTLLVATSISKYVMKQEENHVQGAESFYFTSKILKENNVQYKFNDWQTTENYNIDIDLKNYEDMLRITKSDIQYEITIVNNSSDMATIELKGDIERLGDKYQGTLKGNEKTGKKLQLEIAKIERKTISEDGINFEIIVKSSYPYEKQMSAKFSILPKSQKTTIELIDEKEYANLVINNVDEPKTYKIKYDSQKAIIDITNEKIGKITQNGDIFETTVMLEKNEILNLQFIKSNQSLKLGEDIIVE